MILLETKNMHLVETEKYDIGVVKCSSAYHNHMYFPNPSVLS